MRRRKKQAGLCSRTSLLTAPSGRNLLARPTPWPRLDPARRDLMQPIEKRRRSDRPATLHGGGQARGTLVAQGFVQQGSIGGAAIERRIAQRPVRWSVSEQKLRAQPNMLARAGPERRQRRRHGPFSNRCLVDEDHRLEQLSATLDHRGAIAAIPDTAAALMAPVETRREAPAQGLQRAANGLRARWCAQQPYVVVQQRIGMQRHPLGGARVLQRRQERLPIDIVAENRVPAVPAQQHQVGVIGDSQTGQPGHERTPPTQLMRPDGRARRPRAPGRHGHCAPRRGPARRAA